MTSLPPSAASLPDRLAKAGAGHALLCLSQFTDDETLDEASTSAGLAVELLAKAYLAKLSPILIAPSQVDFDTLLHLSGHGWRSGKTLNQIRTATGIEACRRVHSLIPEFGYTRDDDALFTTRNAAVHLAVSTKEDTRLAARTMVRLLEPLLPRLDLERENFWGNLLTAADSLLDESIEEVQAILTVKYAAARRRLEQRLSGLQDDQRAAVLAAISGRSFFGSEMEVEESCPACRQMGWLGGELEDSGEAQVEYQQVDYDEVEVVGWVDRVFVPIFFECSACDLMLEGREVDAAGFDTSNIDVEARDAEWSDINDDDDGR